MSRSLQAIFAWMVVFTASASNLVTSTGFDFESKPISTSRPQPKKDDFLSNQPIIIKSLILKKLDSLSQWRLMRASIAFRRLAIPSNPKRDNPISREVRQKLIILIMAGESGDFNHFVQVHMSGLKNFTVTDLMCFYHSHHFSGALSHKTPQGRLYFRAHEFIKNNRLCLKPEQANGITGFFRSKIKLRLAPIYGEKFSTIKLIDLSGHELIFWPEHDRMEELRCLNLTANKLYRGPTISLFPRLRVLRLENNRLMSPPTIPKAPQVLELHLHSNRFANPPEVTEQKKLWFLTLDQSCLEQKDWWGLIPQTSRDKMLIFDEEEVRWMNGNPLKFSIIDMFSELYQEFIGSA